MEDEFDFIDDFLRQCEDWMKDEEGENVTLSRKYLAIIRNQYEFLKKRV
jgi:hypothetical protein